jgi:hypothetical protein
MRTQDASCALMRTCMQDIDVHLRGFDPCARSRVQHPRVRGFNTRALLPTTKVVYDTLSLTVRFTNYSYVLFFIFTLQRRT